MRLVVRDSSREASRCVADLIIARLKAFKPTAFRPTFVLGLPTGSSPEQVYAFLVAAYRANEISFKNVVTFNMDEYVGLPAAHSQSYHTFMYSKFFAHIDIPPQNVHILNGLAHDLEKECADYETLIASHGPIDFFLGGVGPSGHIAFNEPYSSLVSRTRSVVLAASTIAANARFFGNDLSAVPKRALTVGVGTIMDAREVCIVANGREKADAIHQAIEGPISNRWTITKLQEHPACSIYIDREAAGGLKAETIEYFKFVEMEEARNSTSEPKRAKL